ncbi:MAG TPA: CapA family protein [Acidimicrobiales bacterium]
MRRNRRIAAIVLVILVATVGLAVGRSGSGRPPVDPHRARTGAAHLRPTANPRLGPDWDGDGRPVTLVFGGDVHFPAGTNLGNRLAQDPATALGPTVPALLAGANLSMVNFESAMVTGSCTDPQPKQYVFFTPTTALAAFRGAGVTAVTEANNHGEDCGRPGLEASLSASAESGYPVLGIGQNAAQAFTPYQATIDGERIAIIAATQVIDSDLATSWTATASQPGLASAYDVDDLVTAVESARRTADTVVVYLHWGTELDDCPNALQEPLAQVLVSAGADIVVGTHAHVLLGAGYLGSAYVDYGLGNFAFYDNSPPENASGTLAVTVTGRRIDSATWRPAVIVNDLPQPLSGTAAAQALSSWSAQRSCTDLAASPSASIASSATETSPAPPAEVQGLSTDTG